MGHDNDGDLSMEARATLLRLLAEHGRGAAMYGSGFSMHLPMVLIALFRMGATPARLEACAGAGAKQGEVRPLAIPSIDAANWERELGRPDTFVRYREYFSDELARASVATVLARHLPRLLPGIAAAGFHALIRLAYGLDLGARDEIAAGLAYLASAFDSLGAADSPLAASSRTIPEAFAAAHAVGVKANARVGRIVDAIRSGMREPAYAAGEAIDEARLSIRALAEAALQTYLERPSIYTVHLVTAAHALKVVADHHAIDRSVLRIFWRCILAMRVAFGAPAVSARAERVNAGDDWEALFAAAVAATDDHAIKFTYSCSVLARTFDDDRFRFAAARMLRRAEAPVMATG